MRIYNRVIRGEQNKTPIAAKDISKLRVCILSTHFYPLHSGGGAQAMRISQVISHADQRFAFSVVTQRYPSTAVHEIVNGLTIFRLGSPWLSVKAPRLAYFHFLILLGWYLLWNGRRFAVLHSLSGYAIGSVAGVFGRLHHRAVIIKIAAGELRSSTNRLKSWLRKIRLIGLKLADVIITVNEQVEQVLRVEGVPADQLLRLPNGVDTALFIPPADSSEKENLRQQLQLDPKMTYAIFVGNIHPEKGIAPLIEAWRQVAQSDPLSHLLLVGDLPKVEAGISPAFVQEFKSLISDEGRRLRITWLGRRQDVSSLLRASDIFVFPSEREGMPNALLEAMASGLPIVSTCIPGVESVARNGTHGFLVPPNNAHALQQAIIMILKMDTEARMALGKASRTHVANNYSLETVRDRYLDLYTSLSSN